MEAKKSRNGRRLREFLGGKTYDEAVTLATCMIINNSYAYSMLIDFVVEQHPGNEFQAAYFIDTVTRLVALSDDEIECFAQRNATSHGYVRMCKIARDIRAIINAEED